MNFKDDSFIRVIFARDEFEQSVILKGDFSSWRLSVIEDFARSSFKKTIIPSSFSRIVDEYVLKSIDFM